jgi:pimeloyl-ACP methyl ester carboxylesterase
MRLKFSKTGMDIGTPSFNFMRTIMVAATHGAEMSECFKTVERIKRGDEESWVREWANLAEDVRRTAVEAFQARQIVTAREAYLRASNYFRAAMMSLPHTDARLHRYLTATRECFQHAASLFSPQVEILRIVFGNARLPGYFLSAGRPGSPTLLALNGGDSTNEEMAHMIGFAAVARGWNFLTFEGPGQWSALQLNPGLLMRPDYEVPVSAVIDSIVSRDDVDPHRIALYGPSLGALLAARTAAHESRLRACVCNGLVVDVGEAWRAVWPRIVQAAPRIIFDLAFRRLEAVSPQLRAIANRFRWMLGVSDPHDIIEAWRPYAVQELASRITCPLLLLYGEAEVTQSNSTVALSALRFAHELPGSVSIHMFGLDEGWASSHCQIGGLASMQRVVFDWLDGAVIRPGPLRRRVVDPRVANVLIGRARGRAARTEAARLLHGISEFRRTD